MSKSYKSTNDLVNDVMSSSSKAQKKAKNAVQVQRDLEKRIRRETEHALTKEQPMDFIKVYSNHLRGRPQLLNNGELILHFDEQGYAKVPAHKKYLVEREMVARPNRLRFVEEAKPKKVTPAAKTEATPAVEEAPSEPEKQVEVQVTSVPDEKLSEDTGEPKKTRRGRPRRSSKRKDKKESN